MVPLETGSTRLSKKSSMDAATSGVSVLMPSCSHCFDLIWKHMRDTFNQQNIPNILSMCINSGETAGAG